MSIEVVKIQEFKGHSQAVYALCYDKTTATVFSGSGDGMIVAWKLGQQDGNLKARLDSAVYCLQVLDGCLYAGSRNGVLSVFALSDFELIQQKLISKSSIFDIIQADSKIFIASQDGFVRCMDNHLNLLWQSQVSTQSVRCLILVDSTVLAGTSEGTVVQLDLNGETISKQQIHDGTIFTLAADTDNKVIYSGGKDAQIKMFAIGGEVQSVPAHLLHVHRLCINFENGWMLSSSMDKTIKVWETKGLRLLKVIDFERYGGHTSSVNKILWIDKNTIISCSDDRTLKCFEIREK